QSRFPRSTPRVTSPWTRPDGTRPRTCSAPSRRPRVRRGSWSWRARSDGCGPRRARSLPCACGWRASSSVPRPPSTNGLADPAAALNRWLGGLPVREPALVVQALSLVARVLGGTPAGVAGVVEGSGSPHDPWLVPLSRIAGLVRLAVWVEPDGPPRPILTQL